jgi:hypothetical protein
MDDVSRPVMIRPAMKAIVVRSFGCMAFIPHSNFIPRVIAQY